MYRWAVGQLVRLGYRLLIAGHPNLFLRLTADDIHFRFPGHSSFAADIHDKAGLRRWVQRFVALEPQFTIHDVVVTGMPWNTRVAIRFSDAIGDYYKNDGMEYIQLRWGRLRALQVFLDTQTVTDWENSHRDATLAELA